MAIIGEGSKAYIKNNMHRDKHCYEAARDNGLMGDGNVHRCNTDKFRENYDAIFRKDDAQRVDTDTDE